MESPKKIVGERIIELRQMLLASHRDNVWSIRSMLELNEWVYSVITKR